MESIVTTVHGYPPGRSAYAKAFERDLDILRSQGIPVRVERIDGPSQYGYRIPADEYYLKDLELSREERLALNLAAAAVRLEGVSASDAVLKLGGFADAEPMASLGRQSTPPLLASFEEAARRAAPVTFVYRGGETREVEPHYLLARGGHWYLVGLDRHRGEQRLFRLDRVERIISVGEANSFEQPPLPETVVLPPPWEFAEQEPLRAEIELDAVGLRQAEQYLGEDVFTFDEQRQAARLELEVSYPEALFNWLFSLTDHAELLGPPELRAELVARLQAIAEAPRRSREAAEPGGGVGQARGASSAHGGRRGQGAVSSELKLLLAMIPWLAERGQVSISEAAQRFGLEERRLVELLERAACCGLPPYTPDQLLELIVSDGRIHARPGPQLYRHSRLRHEEGLALAAAARLLLGVPGADPEGALASALEKLEASLGEHRVVVERPESGWRREIKKEVKEAVESGDELEIEYYSAARDATSWRVVDPIKLYFWSGQWYLAAWCHQAGGLRQFRLDRIFELRRTGRKSPEELRLRYFGQKLTEPVPGEDALSVILEAPSSAQWVRDSYPVEDWVELGDERVRFKLHVAAERWLEPLLLRLGPNAFVIDPPELADVGRKAANRLLQKYMD